MALIGVVALVVIGPERLPGVARSVGKWLGSARRFVSSVQADINAEVSKTDELKRLLEEQTRIQSVHEILEQTPVEADERRPVPRANPASRKAEQQKSLDDNASDRPPEYLVKAINDAPAADDNRATQTESLSDAMNDIPKEKHD